MKVIAALRKMYFGNPNLPFSLIVIGVAFGFWGSVTGVIGMMPAMAASGMGCADCWDNFLWFRVAGAVLVSIGVTFCLFAMAITWIGKGPKMAVAHRVLATIIGLVGVLIGGAISFGIWMMVLSD